MVRAAWVCAVVAACGSSHSAAPDAYPTASHAPWPQLPDQGGPRLAHPQVVTVTFANDARAPMLEAFAQWIVGSSWLAAVGAEYGISGAAVAGVAHRPETPPAALTNADVEAYLAAGIADGSIPHPANLADALYLVYYPATTTITTTFVHGIMATSCSGYEAYHSEAHASGLDFSYAVMPSCGGETTAILQSATSHEFIEAATDAFPITAPAFQLREDPTDVWFSNFSFEVEDGDMCEAPDRTVTEGGYTVQRTWSNTAAAAGGDPGVPGGAMPAFGTSGPSTVEIVPAGGSVDLPLASWSTATVDDFQLALQPWFSDGTALTNAHFSLDATTANNGATPTLHVTMPANARSGKFTRVLLVSSHSATDASMWPVVIKAQ